MKLTLKEFQEAVTDELAKQASFARNEAQGGVAQALTLSSPTGSGKTVVATALMERLLEGDEDQSGDPEATFLWVTDSPDLNEQTRRKIVAGSSVFGEDDLIPIDASFDRSVLDSGKVYFINVQKLGREKQLITAGDGRTNTIWETFTATAQQRPGSFYVVLDEAHKGMQEAGNGRDQAATIVQKFIKGSPGELPPIPLIVGISATPERFNKLLEGTTRNSRPVPVSPEDVRESGLLKDRITLYHPEESQPSDFTLLRAAAAELKRYDEDWEAYCEEESAPSVRPILVVQVEDGTKTRDTKTDLEETLRVLEDQLGGLDDSQVAHAFEEDRPLPVGERSIRHIAPVDIQDDDNLRAVLFKRSLNTGWDCPRAEVMMSFRRAVDHTVIAQLVGRMVRTPLARRVHGNDLLNSVSLYLPYYDEKALEGVISYLMSPDPELQFPTDVQRGESVIEAKRNPAMKACFEAAAGLPTYRIEKVSKQSAVRRLLALGRALAYDKLNKNAKARYENALIKVLLSERRKVGKTKAFTERVAEAAKIDVRGVGVIYGEEAPTEVGTEQLKAVQQNIDDAFKECGRKLGTGLHAAYLRKRSEEKDAPSVSAIKLELYALLDGPDVLGTVESKAAQLLKTELEKHKTAVRKLPDARRDAYRKIRRQTATPEPEDWELPGKIQASREGKNWERHLYVRASGKKDTFPAKLNAWETDVLKEELARKGVIGWLRNDPRKDWSFTVPYRVSESRPMYPDFLIFRKQGDGILCDILEPHSLSFDDSAAKAQGLAEFAKQHGDDFGRIELIAKIGKGLKRLPLNDPETRDKVLGVSDNEHLRQLFEDA